MDKTYKVSKKEMVEVKEGMTWDSEDVEVLKKSEVEKEIESFEDEKLKWLNAVDDYNNPKKVELIRKEDWQNFKTKLLGSEKKVVPHVKSLIGTSEVRGNSSSEKPKSKEGCEICGTGITTLHEEPFKILKPPKKKVSSNDFNDEPNKPEEFDDSKQILNSLIDEAREIIATSEEDYIKNSTDFTKKISKMKKSGEKDSDS